MSLAGLTFGLPASLAVPHPHTACAVHELGHFIMARLAGIRVLEFGLGFPPRPGSSGTTTKPSTRSTTSRSAASSGSRARRQNPTTRDPSQRFAAEAGDRPGRGRGDERVRGGLSLLRGRLGLQPGRAAHDRPDPVRLSAAAAGLQPGDSIVSIDGRTYPEQSVLEFSSADPTQAWRQDLLNMPVRPCTS